MTATSRRRDAKRAALIAALAAMIVPALACSDTPAPAPPAARSGAPAPGHPAARSEAPGPGRDRASASVGAIQVQDAISHPSHSASVGVVYLRIANHGEQPDRLVSIESSVSRRSQLHETIRDGDTLKMEHRAALEIPAGGSVSLEPGGRHIMLMGLESPLRAGQQIEVTLRFENAGEIRVSVPVEPTEPEE